MRLYRELLCLAGLLFCIPAAADDTHQLQKDLKRRLSRHELTLRVPYSNKALEYDANGVCRKLCDRGSWVRDATVLISDVEVSNDELRIWGNRIVVFYSIDGKRTGIRTPIVVTIRVAAPGPIDGLKIDEVLKKVFLNSGEPLPNAAPQDLREWRQRAKDGSTVSAGQLQPVGETEDHLKVFAPGKDVKAPKVTYAPDPRYPGGIGKGRGNVAATAIIDESGFLQVLKIEKLSSPAFLEPAVSALSQWKFQPATHNATPVACRINLEVNFEAY